MNTPHIHKILWYPLHTLKVIKEKNMGAQVFCAECSNGRDGRSADFVTHSIFMQFIHTQNLKNKGLCIGKMCTLGHFTTCQIVP